MALEIANVLIATDWQTVKKSDWGVINPEIRQKNTTLLQGLWQGIRRRTWLVTLLNRFRNAQTSFLTAGGSHRGML